MSHLRPVPSDPDELIAWLAQQGAAQVEPFLGLRRNPDVDLPEPPAEGSALTVEVTLRDTDPSVWRHLVVPGELTLDRVHDVVQAAMGWTDSHLHRFYAGSSEDDAHFVTEWDLEEGEEGTPEKTARLDQLLREVGDAIRYDYDFGDGWEHDLTLRAVAPLDEDARPRCLDGARACPPEDVGGPGGYDDVATWVRLGRPRDGVPAPFDSYDDAIAWLPADWHPDDFDVEEVGLRLRAAVASTELLARLRPEAIGAVLRLSAAGAATVSEWIASASQRSLSAADVEELTAPYRGLLAVIGSGVELTGSGYLRPPVVQELCAVLGVDPIAAGKANRESNVRPLAMFRKVAQETGLLHKSGGLLTPTVAGIRYGGDPAGLWAHVTTRLPTGRGELRQDVGWFTLLAVAGGVAPREVYDAVHRLCVDSGWQTDGGPIDRYTVVDLVWPTVAALVGVRRRPHDGWPDWGSAAAASVIFTRGAD